MSKKLPRNKDGKKMYPICSWERNQHKVYIAHTRAMNRCHEENWSEESVKNLEYVSIAYDNFDSCIRDGVVYATWDVGQVIKDLIYGYDATH